jgi:hypothetical protein
MVDGPSESLASSGSGSDIVRVNCSRPIRVSAVGRGPGRQLSLHVPRPGQPAGGRAAPKGMCCLGSILSSGLVHWQVAPVPLLPVGRMGLSTGRARLVGEARYRQVRYRSVRDQLDSGPGQRGVVRPRGKGTRAAPAAISECSGSRFWAARDCLHGARVSGV